MRAVQVVHGYRWIAPTRRSLRTWGLAVIPPFVVGGVFAFIMWFLLFPWFGDLETYQRGSRMMLAGQSPYAAWQLAGPFDLPEAFAGAGYVYHRRRPCF